MEAQLDHTAKSCAKVNLFLHILGKRADGYHDIYTLFCGISLYDEIKITASSHTHIICNRQDIPVDGGNIIMRVDSEVRRRYPLLPHYRVELHKSIPAGAGLGGGSGNACTYLQLLNSAASLNLDKNEMHDILTGVGSDTAFFLELPYAIGEGRGEVLTPVEYLPPLKLLLVNPGINISTAKVYGSSKLMLTRSTDLPKMPVQINLHELCDLMSNDLEGVVLDEYPEVRRLCADIGRSGALKALMSGSGSTVFGIYADDDTRSAAYADMCRRYPGYGIVKADSLHKS